MKANVNFREINMNTAVLYGLEDGEYAIAEIGRVDTLAMRIPSALRKRGTSAFTAYIQESVEFDGFPNETGFYPVRKGGKTSLGFYHDGRIEFISREFARDVRLSGGLIDLDAEVERKEVLKHLNHIEAENRGLRKEVKELREELLKKAPSSRKGKKATETTKEEAISDLLDEAGLKLVVDKTKSSGGLKYVPPKDDDDDRLY